MATQTESVSNVFEQVFDNLRKTADSNIEMQQELFRQWGANWPGFPQPENAWLDRVQKFQKEWTKTSRGVGEQAPQDAGRPISIGDRLAQGGVPRGGVGRSAGIPASGAKSCAARVSS